MTLWPRIEETSGEDTAPPAPLWPDLSATNPEAADAPAVDLAASSDAPAAAPPPVEPAALQPPLRQSARRRARLLAGFALLMSAGLHAATLAFFLDRMSRAGVEAETDAVSVEIVLEAPPQLTVAASGGIPQETTEAEGIAEAEPTSVELEEDVAATELEPDVAAERADTAPDDPVSSRAPVSDATERVPRSAEAEPLPEPDVEEQEQPERERASARKPGKSAEPAERPLAVIAPRDPVAELTPPLPAPATMPEEKVFAEAPTPEFDAPVPSPRPAYSPPQKAKPKKQAEEHAVAETKTRKTQTPAKTGKAQPEAGATASIAGSTGAKGGASAGAAAKYGQRLLSHVERHKRYPKAAARQKITGATKLAITIDRSGRLAGARVAGGSGHALLDEAALDAARRAAPYPRPPEGVGGGTFSFGVTMRFKR